MKNNNNTVYKSNKIISLGTILCQENILRLWLTIQDLRRSVLHTSTSYCCAAAYGDHLLVGANLRACD